MHRASVVTIAAVFVVALMGCVAPDTRSWTAEPHTYALCTESVDVAVNGSAGGRAGLKIRDACQSLCTSDPAPPYAPYEVLAASSAPCTALTDDGSCSIGGDRGVCCVYRERPPKR